MLEGIEQGILSLPVHDAIAVKQGDAEWAKEALERVWIDEALGCKTRLKIDYPDQSNSENNNFNRVVQFRNKPFKQMHSNDILGLTDISRTYLWN